MEKMCIAFVWETPRKEPARSLVVEETRYDDVTLLSCLLLNFCDGGDEIWIP
jgi:hypothetical protein